MHVHVDSSNGLFWERLEERATDCIPHAVNQRLHAARFARGEHADESSYSRLIFGVFKQYLRQLRKTAGVLRGMNTA
jgi:hypothetical protein